MAPEMIIAPKPDINRTNMQARRILVWDIKKRKAPAGAFQTTDFTSFRFHLEDI